MGKKRRSKKDLKKIYAIIVFFIAVLVAWKTPALEVIDNTIANTGIAQIVDTSKTSNVTSIATVKVDKDIMESVSQNIVVDKDKLNIFYLDVGQADCELIINHGKTMLMDAGNSKDGEKIVNGLKALGVTKIDYLIGTHVHEDHIGGMSYIVDAFDIGEIYLPYNTTSTSSYYRRLLTSIINKSLEITEVVVGDKFSIDNAICEIMCVQNDEPENANLSSIVFQINYGKMKYLFMGDAEIENENARTWEDIDVLKVGHHGSNTSSSKDFLNTILPEIAIISVGEGNSYGLPKEKVLKSFEKIGTTIYRTDRDGTIQITSDGIQNSVTKIDVTFDGN